jgi:V8-like Glu-specific endopeptidase
MKIRLFAFAACAAIFATQAPAQDLSAGSEGSGETPRAAMPSDYQPRGGQQVELDIDVDEASRAMPGDESEILGNMAAVGRSLDGKELRVEPDEAMRYAIETDLSAGAAGAAPEEFGEEDRTVLGADDRVQVKNTKQLPFRTIGYIETVTADGNFYRCSGTLIGPRTVMTAAHCLYNHKAGGWYKEFYFVPGMVDIKNMPYGVYAAQEVYIVEGYISQYQGTDGSVFPWDLGVMILTDPIGEGLGWMAYNHYAKFGDFEATTAGYPGDKPDLTMWLTSCAIDAEMTNNDNFLNDCDNAGGASGSSMWAVDKNKKRTAVGVVVGEAPQFNIGVRINAAYKQWLNSLNQ